MQGFEWVQVSRVGGLRVQEFMVECSASNKALLG